jgi:hypothetical protein
MTQAQPTGPFATEHEALSEAATTLRAALGGACPECAPDTACRCLRDRFEEFHGRLLRHFDEEEKLWRGVDRRTTDWTTLHWIARMVQDHGRFRRKAGELRLALADPTPGDELREGLCGLLDELLEHELSESRLLQRAVFEESPDCL